ncbi:ABC transporter permease [Streptomyces antibioticus]|uniref:ABC transporter permease n=1 Tax=Streptomyces antibioticus TaxID=1890 RepID=UPI0033B446CE
MRPRVRIKLSKAARGNPLMTIGTVIAAAVVIVALFAPLLAPYPADAGSATHPYSILQAPGAHHWFGTDQVGRDVLSRVIYGARISPVIAVVVVATSLLVGGALGLIAGYAGGWIDELIMRITDIFLAVPALLLALAFATVLPPSPTSTMIAISVSWWPWYARLMRGQAAALSRRRYIESCRALGLPHWRILLRHLLPNSLTPMFVQASLDFGGVILTASALSFLGLGAQDPSPEWGLSISQGQALFQVQWWLVTFPGLAVLLTALAFNLIGDGLRDRLDTRQVTQR